MSAARGDGYCSYDGSVEGGDGVPGVGPGVVGDAVGVGLLGGGVVASYEVELSAEAGVLPCCAGLYARCAGYVGQGGA